MAIKTEMLRYFVEVAQAGNLAVAAKNLGRTSSAVSMMLKQFEEHLGAPLFVANRKNQLTKLGEFTLKEAEQELFHFDNTVSSILRYAHSNEGLVRLSSVPSIATFMLPEVILAMQKLVPNIFIDINDVTMDGVLQQLNDGTIDIGIINEIQILDTERYGFRNLLSDRYGIIFHHDSPLAKKDKLYWSDLASVTYIDNYLCRAIDEPAVRKATVRSNLKIASPMALLALIKSQAGVTVVPEIAGSMMTDDLRFVVPEGNVYQRKVQLVWDKVKTPLPAVAMFCDELDKVIDKYKASRNIP